MITILNSSRTRHNQMGLLNRPRIARYLTLDDFEPCFCARYSCFVDFKLRKGHHSLCPPRLTRSSIPFPTHMYKKHCGIDCPQPFRKRKRNRRELVLGFRSFIWCEHVSTEFDHSYLHLGRDNPSPSQALLFACH